MIYIFSDSHWLMFEDGEQFRRGAPCFTAYGVADKEAEIRQFLEDNFKEGDEAWFACGEIDIRWYIYEKGLENKISLEESIDIVVNRYTIFLRWLSIDYPIKVVSAVPPPLNVEPHLVNHMLLPLETRVKITKLFNKALKSRCDDWGLPFIDVYNKLDESFRRDDGLHFRYIGHLLPLQK